MESDADSVFKDLRQNAGLKELTVYSVHEAVQALALVIVTELEEEWGTPFER